MYGSVVLRITKQTMGITHIQFFITDNFLITQGEADLDLDGRYSSRCDIFLYLQIKDK